MIYNITDFGAQTDGTLCTSAIQQAIDHCAVAGGTVLIPAGVFLTGTITLCSNIHVRLEPGAVLKGSSNLADYKEFGHTHNELGPVLSLIHATECENIFFSGQGTIDFNGSSFFDFDKPYNQSLDISGYTPKQRQQFEARTEGRPNQTLFLRHCKNITMKDLTFKDAPCWGLVFSSCDDVRLTNLRLRFSLRLPNDDGIHLSSCHNVIITGCDIVSGDDCIAISGIDDWKRESRNILISNCLLSSSSSGVRICHWRSKVKGVQISNCTIYNSVRGINMMVSESGYLEDVTISGLQVHTRGLAGTWWGRGEAIYMAAVPFSIKNFPGAEFDEEPRACNIRNITLRDITTRGEMGIVMLGKNKNIRDIRIYNADISIRNSPNRALFGDELDTKPTGLERSIPEDAMYWLYAEEVEGLRIVDACVYSYLEGKVNRLTEKLTDCGRVQLENVRVYEDDQEKDVTV